MFASLQEAQLFFQQDRFATSNGMVIDELGEDYVIASMTLQENHRNATGNVMGGVYFTLADFAFAVLVNHIHQVSVGLDASITFLTPAKGTKLIATATLIRSGRSTTFGAVTIRDELGRQVAHFTSSAFKLS